MRASAFAFASLFAAGASDQIPIDESSSLMQLKIPSPTKPEKHTMLLGMNIDTIEGRAALLEKVKKLVKDFEAQDPEDSPLRTMAASTIATARGVLDRVLSMEADEDGPGPLTGPGEMRVGSIMRDHDSSIAEMQTEVDAVNACRSGDQATVDGLDASVEAKRELHTGCRAQENELALEKCHACGTWENFVTGLTVPHCELSHNYDTLQTELLALQSFAASNAEQATQLHQACVSATAAAEAKALECQEMQLSFEQDYCGYRASCSGLDGCYDRTMANYDAIWATIETAIDSRKIQWQVISQIGCFLDLIVQAADMEDGTPAPVDDEALAQCAVLATTDHLNIIRTNTTAPDACNEVTMGDATCSAPFFAREYTFPTSECLDQDGAVEAACVPCPGAPVALPAALPAGR